MGRAYLARQTEPERMVVVKLLHENLVSDPYSRSMFKQEIDCLSRFRHRYAVELYEASADTEDGPVAVMEYVDGQLLDSVLAHDGPFTLERVGRLLGKLCAVLQAAHDRGIVHRDLKPGNIMLVEPNSPSESIKVLDFGLARRIGDAAAGLYLPLEKFVGSRVHKSVGTPEYTCPEQFRGDEVGPRGDLYSVGVILFELLTGRLPFDAAKTSEFIEAHLHATPPPLRGAVGARRFPPALEALIHACLAKDPNERPASARELALLYEKVLGSPIWDEGDAKAVDAAPAKESVNGNGTKDDNVDRFRLEAWMPQSIAAFKLRGFVDERGEVSDSAPGYLKVRLRMPGRAVAAEPRSTGLLSRFGLGRKAEPPPEPELVDVEMFMESPDASKPSKLLVSVHLHPPDVRSTEEATRWFDWCKRVQVDLAAYLMGKKVD
jgi:serine/threonine-protein kinase